MNLPLGDYNPQAPPKISPAGLTYWAFGLDEYGPKRVKKKCVNRMVAEGVSPAIIAEFREWALRLPTELPAWIDTAWATRLNDWFACVGCRLPNGATITDTGLHSAIANPPKIILHPEPFRVPQGVLTAGAAYNDRIEVVIAFLDQHGTWLRKCDDLIVWEAGNWIARRFGFSPQDASQEIGSKSPC